MQYKNNLLYKLTEYGKEGLRPFHMPGHKRNSNYLPLDAYNIDITEIDDFDDLHHPQDCLKDAMKRASAIYETKETFFLVNGCTGGILAAISALCNRGEKILLAKNSHKSAYNAAYINELELVYLHSNEFTDNISGQTDTAKKVEEAFAANPDIKCVFITSPTYEGYVSDIKKIADITHANGALLIVDEAHGAHMPFGDIFPKSAVACDADIVIHGIHKTLPSLTQTALLHVTSDRVDLSEIKRYLSIFQTSSPSYILMGAIDYCMDFLEQDRNDFFNIYCNNLKSLYCQLEKLNNLYVLAYSSETRDASKIVICTDKSVITGSMLYKILRQKYNLQPEMSQPDYVIMMTSVWDNKNDYEKLIKALFEIDSRIGCDISADEAYDICAHTDNSGYEAVHDTDILRRINAKPGDIADDIIYVYPPGIPIISAGEIYTEEIIEKINYYIENGYRIKSNKG